MKVEHVDYRALFKFRTAFIKVLGCCKGILLRSKLLHHTKLEPAPFGFLSEYDYAFTLVVSK